MPINLAFNLNSLNSSRLDLVNKLHEHSHPKVFVVVCKLVIFQITVAALVRVVGFTLQVRDYKAYNR